MSTSSLFTLKKGCSEQHFPTTEFYNSNLTYKICKKSKKIGAFVYASMFPHIRLSGIRHTPNYLQEIDYTPVKKLRVLTMLEKVSLSSF